jgi:hypothetical protein
VWFVDAVVWLLQVWALLVLAITGMVVQLVAARWLFGVLCRLFRL